MIVAQVVERPTTKADSVNFFYKFCFFVFVNCKITFKTLLGSCLERKLTLNYPKLQFRGHYKTYTAQYSLSTEESAGKEFPHKRGSDRFGIFGQRACNVETEDQILTHILPHMIAFLFSFFF